MKRFIQEYLFFTPFERRGIAVLALLLFITFGVGYWRKHYRQPQVEGMTDSVAHEVLKSLLEHERNDHPRRQRLAIGDHLASFNPNDADSATLAAYGFKPWMIRNLMKYRAKGGRFKKPNDLRRLYGMTDTLYTALEPYIAIPPLREEEKTRPSLTASKGSSEKRTYPQRDSVPSVYLPAEDTIKWVRQEKYPEGTRIELNLCDTTALKKIPGIGSYTARRIVEYRARLGGYRQLRQLREIRLNDEVLSPWFTLDTTALSKLPVNRLPMKPLMAHPYLNFRQAKAILTYRQRHKRIPSIEVMAQWEEFTPNELQRVAPYLLFD